MAISKQQFEQLIKEADLKAIFHRVLGWDHDGYIFKEQINNETFICECLAEKRGYKIVQVKPASGDDIPISLIRKKINNAITKRFRENLIIFSDNIGHQQIWYYTVRKPGNPSFPSETRYHAGQSPELLFQKLQGIFFNLDEQDNITILDVINRVGDSFERNAKQVVKKFYRDFQHQHQSFLKFIKGIKEEVTKEWYASLMLNRLMFCYFIQRKGFLNDDTNYLQSKLRECTAIFGKDKFYSFYRTFLLTLFHKGLGSPSDERTQKEADLLGKIPYLNGGLFDEHIIEKENVDSIQIKDEAFENVFQFFDEWNWHLDTREHATDNNINPDVIGYIFEQYINDRAKMGAYYTKEDITDYISKTSIFPWLAEELSRNYAKPFEANGEFLLSIKNSGDTYIYPAIKHGISWDINNNNPLTKPVDLPNGVLIGSLAIPEAALPTETWMEVMDRRRRYDELLIIVRAGGIKNLSDCITYNLNISQIMFDWLWNTNDPRAIEYFYRALTRISILDPTCGSGAFLFAALNLLERLYEICLMKMRNFVDEEDTQNATDKQVFKNAHKYFRSVLEDVQHPSHPNPEYFIYKAIILHNLYGVDLMNEATEIAKLRLFLKLMSTVNPDIKKQNLGLEPLPDIDFNIRCGNTLIGFVTMEQMKQKLGYDIEGQSHLPEMERQCQSTAKSYEHFKEMQLHYSDDHEKFKKAKIALQEQLDALNFNLNTYLAKTYGIFDREKMIQVEVSDGKEKKKRRVNQYEYWVQNYRPFHWFAEFYDIIHNRGGFDVVIGNPPYVVYSDKSSIYKLIPDNFKTFEAKNLYAYVFEQSIKITSSFSKIGLIVQLTAISSEILKSLQDYLLKTGIVTILPFPRRPESIFESVEMPVVIILLDKSEKKVLQTTNVQRFYTEERAHALQTISYQQHNIRIHGHRIGKISNEIEMRIFNTINKSRRALAELKSKKGQVEVYYQEACRYWMKAIKGVPFFKKNGVAIRPPHGRFIQFDNEQYSSFVFCFLSSSLFYWVYSCFSDCEHVNDSLIMKTLIPADSELNKVNWIELSNKLSASLIENSYRKSITTKNGDIIEYDEYKIARSKNQIDEIDDALSIIYGFQKDEVEYIKNYDIKYRMGKEVEEVD